MLPPGNRRQVFHWEKYRRSADDSCIANEPPKNAHWNTPYVYRVFQKSRPLKLFGIFSLGLCLFAWILQSCWQFMSTYIYKFLQIYLNISSNVINFSTSTHCFYPVKFWVFTHKMKMQCTSFGNDVIFCRHMS